MQRDQGELGDRAAGIADCDREELADAAVAEPEPKRQRDRRGEQERDDADRDLGAREVPDLIEAADLTSGLDRLALVEDEVDGAAERAEERGHERRGDHSARTFRHGAMKRCARTSSPSKLIASATARTLPKTMFVLKTSRWMPSL